MTILNVLNLYAGIGGNRKLWTDVDVTAVEIEPKIAKIYRDFFPHDKMVVGDAHKYLLEHYEEFDFIWSSPPCPTHSRMRLLLKEQGKICFPDMKLYEEIIFLKTWCRNLWVVENVISYYDPLIKPYECASHYFWSNFPIAKIRNENRNIKRGHMDSKEKSMGFYIRDYDEIKDKERVLNNCVKPKIGLHVLDCARRLKQVCII